MKRENIWAAVRLVSVVAAAGALAGCVVANGRHWSCDDSSGTGRPVYVRSGYTCCNLHYSGDWISDSNLGQLLFVPAGTPISVKSIWAYRAYVDVTGQSMRLGLDYGRSVETTEQWVNKLVVLEDPKKRIATFAPAVQAAIEAGRLMIGMTKEQVIMAVGYPQTDETPRLDAQYWRYWWSPYASYTVHWTNNKVRKIEGPPEIVARVTHTGE